jgi:L-lactate dehydrogenase complex protein LldG
MPPLAPQDYQSKFEAEWEKVSGIAYRVEAMNQLEAILRKIMMLLPIHSVVVSRNPLLGQLKIAERLEAAGKVVASWADESVVRGTRSLADFNKSAFDAGVGITGVDYVLAETGSLVLSAATEGVQIASLAPPIHIALYRRSQLVGSLDEVLARLPISASKDESSPCRSLVFVTGTSRTADIEQILIHGVHGPRETHAILVEDCCH